MLPPSRHRQTLIAPLVATVLAGAEKREAESRQPSTTRSVARVDDVRGRRPHIGTALGFGIACPPLVIAQAPNREHFPSLSCASQHGSRSRRLA